MATEWEAYQEFRATADITATELGRLLARRPRLRVIDARWVTMRKGDGIKARPTRTDSPNGSHFSIMTTLAFASQHRCLDAKSAYLQAENIERIVLLRLAHAHPPRGCHPSQVAVALGATYCTMHAGSASVHAKSVFVFHVFVETMLEKAFYVLRVDGNFWPVIHTHVGDFLFAGDGSPIVAEKMATSKRSCA